DNLPGEPASLTVMASGAGTLSYQWEKSVDAGNTWTEVAGATSDTLSFASAAHTDAGLYRCLVADADAPVEPAVTTSNWAYLALYNDSTGFIWDPANSTMVYDGAAADSVIDPYTQVGNDIAIGFGDGSSSELTVNSGTLTILNVDQWSPKIGQ